jgi:hypothetical protein
VAAKEGTGEDLVSLRPCCRLRTHMQQPRGEVALALQQATHTSVGLLLGRVDGEDTRVLAMALGLLVGS